jgi:hypothetical protein
MRVSYAIVFVATCPARYRSIATRSACHSSSNPHTGRSFQPTVRRWRFTLPNRARQRRETVDREPERVDRGCTCGTSVSFTSR